VPPEESLLLFTYTVPFSFIFPSQSTAKAFDLVALFPLPIIKEYVPLESSELYFPITV
jgi:hypothetical protein